MKQTFIALSIIAVIASCGDKDIDIPLPPPSSGSTMQLNGLSGETGETGSSARNSVFVDFSADKQTSILRSNWDLGFYTGSEFKIKINNTTGAYASVTNKTDINIVGSADTVGVKLEFNQNEPSSEDLTKMDDFNGSISGIRLTASANESENKVFILNRGTRGGIGTRDYMKIRVLRNGNTYTLQYAALAATSFKTAQISKNGDGDFVYISLDNGNTLSSFPAKKDWDIVWTYSAYKTNFGGMDVMYPFSDLVALNVLNNVQAFQALYANNEVAADAFTKFNKDSLSKYSFSNNRWLIGSSWRYTGGPPPSPAPFTRKDRFYVVKDPSGNVYKLKFLSFATEDGGTRGKPEIKYELIK
ncbi:HmuY family protein [Niabella ginsengisoli]|uniref:HmuY family protein n=1 Tax=Niabella ginsengisoli TaxID=522298 RepID=A0ABS9SQC4_9BACT|nr:HmuY family protein [Niabella ginsengisoli]MCH5600567.1 HmuY family protein [Niabella ginsengisoli]